MAEKENRAGWPGSFCVELDAVTSQRGATGLRCAFRRLRRVTARKMVRGERNPRIEPEKHERRCLGWCKRLAMHPLVSIVTPNNCFHGS
jgi:hypothetical protein